MDRTQALARLQTLGLNRVMSLIGRDTNDGDTGYGPALDAAFLNYINLRGLSTSVLLTDVASADEYGFQILMRATTYDMLLPELATMVDTSVDAPLTSAKFSQMFRAFQALRDDAWRLAAQYGYGIDQNVGGFKVNLDFREPGCATKNVAEFG